MDQYGIYIPWRPQPSCEGMFTRDPNPPVNQCLHKTPTLLWQTEQEYINLLVSNPSGVYTAVQEAMNYRKGSYSMGTCHDQDFQLAVKRSNRSLCLVMLPSHDFCWLLLDGRWVWHNTGAHVNVGDTVYYWVVEIDHTGGHTLTDQHFVIPGRHLALYGVAFDIWIDLRQSPCNDKLERSCVGIFVINTINESMLQNWLVKL